MDEAADPLGTILLEDSGLKIQILWKSSFTLIQFMGPKLWKFCTCHGNCAKFNAKYFVKIWMGNIYIFKQIIIMSKKMSMD